ncbi:hypothetical protein WN51_07576 [Melipona quadrifasciata]|uniref:Uncharacterized protein n=1 Tax=Melipona quadrifasciata TaxID=166423 RepID=A0A0M9A7B5_9HYME|nr:hypothetical protein WN51_07576 [Melipona quadrifasciata]
MATVERTKAEIPEKHCRSAKTVDNLKQHWSRHILVIPRVKQETKHTEQK